MLKTCPLCMFFLFESINIPILKGGGKSLSDYLVYFRTSSYFFRDFFRGQYFYINSSHISRRN